MISTQQAADKLGVTRRRVLAMIAAKQIPADRFGNAWMIDEKNLKLVADRKPGRPSARRKLRG
jgi:excisionase family DNA binding protein